MSDTAVTRRPAGVTFVAILIFLAALYNIGLGIWMIISPIGSNPTIPGTTDQSGNGVQIPGWWLILNGALALLLGLIYLWLGQMTLVGSQSAQVLIQVLCVINIVFALFRLPYGWIGLALNVVILIIVSTGSAKAWFSRNP